MLSNNWPVIFKTLKIRKNNEKSRNYHRAKETKEVWLLSAMWYPGLNARIEKGHRKIIEVQMKPGVMLIVMDQYWFLSFEKYSILYYCKMLIKVKIDETSLFYLWNIFVNQKFFQNKKCF